MMLRLKNGKEPHQGVNPDEVVAVGAAIQAGVLTGEVDEVLLLDVTPLSLGVETLGGVMTRLIERNATIPIRKSEVFSTAEDSQPSVDINVLQGEREMAGDNRSLGKFRLEGIPAAPRGIPQIEVAFDIDANGIINVSAQDKSTGREQTITISGSTTLDKEEVDRMIRDSEINSAEDKRKREEAEIRNQADSLAYTVEKELTQVGDKLPVHEKERVEQLVRDLRDALKEGSDIQKIRTLTSDLQQATVPYGKMFSAPVAALDHGYEGVQQSWRYFLQEYWVDLIQPQDAASPLADYHKTFGDSIYQIYLSVDTGPEFPVSRIDIPNFPDVHILTTD